MVGHALSHEGRGRRRCQRSLDYASAALCGRTYVPLMAMMLEARSVNPATAGITTTAPRAKARGRHYDSSVAHQQVSRARSGRLTPSRIVAPVKQRIDARQGR